MKAILGALLLCFLGFGCARIYRPVALAPLRPATQAEDLVVSAELQPWGDNSRYERKALRANLRVLVLGLENRTADDLEILGLELPEATSTLTPEEALRLVQQQPWAYLLYPLVPTLMIPGGESKGSYGPSDQTVFAAMAVVGLAVGLPNALIAARSNRRLGDFFRDHAWAPARLRSGQARRGLLFLRHPDPTRALDLQLRCRTAAGEQLLTVTCPGLRPR
ncbi:MAG: hypothetical protein U0P46_13960 [Holophagaceae bacterium]